MLKEAKYEKMRKDILAKILSGQFPDMRLPSIKQLAETYGVSLMTANRAVKLLEEAGIVQCRPGNVGTFIDEKQAACSGAEENQRHICNFINSFVDQKVKIKFLCCNYNSESQAVLKELVSIFRLKYPWIEIEISSASNMSSELEKKEYDVLQIFGRDLKRYQQQRHLMDITKLVEGSIDQEKLFPCALEHCKADGKFFGLPQSINTPLIFYNKDYFSNRADKLNSSWDAFLTAAKQLAANESYAAFNAGMLSIVHYFIGDIHNMFTSSVDKAALQKLLKILKYVTLSAPNDTALEANTVTSSFLNQDVHMLFAYSSYMGEFYQKYKGDWGILRVPQEKYGTPVTEATLNSISIHSKHKKECWLFVKFLSSQEAQDILLRHNNFIPAHKEVFNNIESKHKEKLQEIIQDAVPSTVSSQSMYTIYSRIHPVVENYFASRIHVSEAVETIIEYVREMLFVDYLD